MRRSDPRRFRAVTALVALCALSISVGAGSPKKKKGGEDPPKVEEAIADLAYIASATDLKLEGVGLVVGLDNTGVDAPPSWYRQKLVDEMRRNGIERANDLLKNPRLSMVIVRVMVPAGASTKDRLDVQVELPPASGTKSLAGGYLLQCRLREVMVLGGVPKEGSDAAFAQGPVMIGNPAAPDDPKVGRVLGGGRIRKEVPFQLILKENRKSFRTSSLVEGVINQRFPQSEGVEQKGSVTAKTDQLLELKVPRIYHQNQDRFFRVVKLMPVIDNPSLRMERMKRWGEELLNPSSAGLSALRLEGLGVTAADILKNGLSHENAQVRFFAAEAMAYLNDPSGSDALADSAVKYPEFRAQALAALAALDHEVAHIKLRRLMDLADVEVRYGAFNALRVMAPDDPFLGQVRVLNAPKEETEDEAALGIDRMAIAMGGFAPSRKNVKVEDPFSLYIVESEGPPMVHVSQSRRCEIVVFGRGMRLLTPIVLGTGAILLNAAENDDRVEISKIVPSSLADADAKVVASLDLGDVLRHAANIGASYPDIVAILQGADKQKNLPGPLVLDAVPRARPEYLQAAILGADATAKKDPAVNQTKGEGDSEKERRGFLDRLRDRFRPKR